MKPKIIEKSIPHNQSLKPLNEVDSCEVSKASVEIMLERFSNGKEIDFPFSK